MASVDGGHYFLTILAPVRREWVKGLHEQTTAPMILLREKLARMPTAMQTPASTASGRISNFSKSSLTHFARFAVIDRLGYNGYVAADPVLTTLRLQRPIEHREELERPYLLFAAEFDAPSGSPVRDLAVYLRELWDVMQKDLVDIFQNCVGFDPDKITTAADFITYIKQCEIDTTMPFNWYWVEDPKLESLRAGTLLTGAALTGLVLGGGVWWVMQDRFPTLSIIVGVLLFLIAAVLYVAIDLKAVGDKPFPASPDGDLQTVLKALHLQTTFGRFVADYQTASDEKLYNVFGEYLEANKVQEAEPKHPAGKVYP